METGARGETGSSVQRHVVKVLEGANGAAQILGPCLVDCLARARVSRQNFATCNLVQVRDCIAPI